MHAFLALAPLAAGALGTASPDYQDRFELIADAVTSASSCEQLGFEVDREGLVDWSEAARAEAVSSGASETRVQADLERAIRDEYSRILKRHARAEIMQHAPDNVERNNRMWLSRCEKLAKGSATGAFFSKS